ncbi:MAG: ferritin family protein [Chitinivibrionales bacterium]|nr:ferritin family protein [Chitinivibrionales bacterium]
MPALQFNADEIFTMAEKIEKNGARFYRQAVALFPAHAELLEMLARMEDNHFVRFSEMHKAISEREKEALTSDPDDEVVALAQAWAGTHVFDFRKDPVAFLKGVTSFPDVVNFAIGIEKESIVFYLGMKEMVPAVSGKDQLDAIIKEEMSHIRILNDLL